MEANKGVRGMPWLSETTKDVVSCEKLRGAANEHRSVDVRMGEPCRLKTCNHRKMKRTWGTETSKYLEEKKTIVIP
jgi:hypothetical protein